MISLIHHSGRVKGVMVFIFGCHMRALGLQIVKTRKRTIELLYCMQSFLKAEEEPFCTSNVPISVKKCPTLKKLWNEHCTCM